MYLSTLDDFINKYFNVLAKSLQEPTDKIVSFFKNIIKIRPNINVSFDLAGNPNFETQETGHFALGAKSQVFLGTKKPFFCS